MPLIAYVDKSFAASTMEVIDAANRIIAEYMDAGYRLTLRQLYYQFVSRDLLPNKQKEYKRLGSIINDARLAGLIDWSAIEDRGRNLLTSPSWSSPESIVRSCAQQFQLDPWEDQEVAPEVWIEKEALIGVISRVCTEHRLPHFACKGYTSQSEMWSAGYHRISEAIQAGKTPHVFHFGDHDPSGIDMTRDIEERLGLFAGEPVRVERLALNMDQVEEHGPPPNPAKVTDSRFAGYQEIYGDESWELDALEPKLISGLISDSVAPLIDWDAWGAAMEQERAHRETLKEISNRWDDVEEYLS